MKVNLNLNKIKRRRKKIDNQDWVNVGYTEDGRLIQYNKNNGLHRELDKWVEIYKQKILL